MSSAGRGGRWLWLSGYGIWAAAAWGAPVPAAAQEDDFAEVFDKVPEEDAPPPLVVPGVNAPEGLALKAAPSAPAVPEAEASLLLDVPPKATPRASAGAVAAVEVASEDSKETPPASEAAASSEALGVLQQRSPRETRRFQYQNSWRGSVGGIHLIDAGSAPAGSFRAHFGLGFSVKNDFLNDGDHHEYIGGVLGFSWSLLDYLELFSSIQAYGHSNDQSNPELLQVLGDALLGVKGYHRLFPWLALGGDFGLALLNGVGDLGLALESTSVELGANASVDMREHRLNWPFIARMNLRYRFDNSGKLVEDTEAARLEGLADRAADPSLETRHLVTPVERLGLGIQRVDSLTLGLGVEVPWLVREDFIVAPLLEWRWAIPVNRQGYSCLFIPDAPGSETPASPGDGCLEIQGTAATAMDLTVGLRVTPPLHGLSTFAAADIGLTGTGTFVRELTPNLPYVIRLGVAYAYDTAPRERLVKRVVVKRERIPPPPVAPLPRLGRVSGVVVDQDGAPVADALAVRRGASSRPAFRSGPAGEFLTNLLRPGEHVFEVSHPDYVDGVCAATLPKDTRLVPKPASEAAEEKQGATAKDKARAPAASEKDSKGTAKVASDETESSADASEDTQGRDAAQKRGPALPWPEATQVELRCVLEARPRQASLSVSVRSDAGPVAAATVTLSGGASAETDAAGKLSFDAQEAGDYTLSVRKDGFFDGDAVLTLVGGETATVELMLAARPQRSSVSYDNRRIKLRRRIRFANASTEINEVSLPILYALKEILQTHPELKRVEIQGHTDDRGSASVNLSLSRKRAETVRRWLVERGGIEAGRLTAVGYGDKRPLVPNLTAMNRRRNRRVQFVIVERAPQ